MQLARQAYINNLLVQREFLTRMLCRVEDDGAPIFSYVGQIFELNKKYFEHNGFKITTTQEIVDGRVMIVNIITIDDSNICLTPDELKVSKYLADNHRYLCPPACQISLDNLESDGSQDDAKKDSAYGQEREIDDSQGAADSAKVGFDDAFDGRPFFVPDDDEDSSDDYFAYLEKLLKESSDGNKDDSFSLPTKKDVQKMISDFHLREKMESARTTLHEFVKTGASTLRVLAELLEDAVSDDHKDEANNNKDA